MVKLAVIIPYYQRVPGLLRRAVESVLSQTKLGDTEIVVINDSSPHPPHSELADLIHNGRCSIAILNRANGGPGAARNSGLDHVSGRVSHVSFLDSDDTFAPEHLLKMRTAFSAGAEFYFCDTKRPNCRETQFTINGFPRGSLETFCPEHQTFWYRDPLISLNLTNAPYGANSIGYRLIGQEHVRFPIEFRRACEDRFFVAELARTVCQVAFSTTCDVALGKGVNIFAGSVWGTREAVFCALDTTRFHVRLGAEFPLSAEDRQRNEDCLANCDRSFWANVIVATAKCGRPPIRAARAYLKIRPKSYRTVPGTVVSLAKTKLKKHVSG
jgi:succinoglycan biosynthesis protein ExoW